MTNQTPAAGGGLRALWLECREFIREQSAGEWGDKVEREDTEKLVAFVSQQIALADAGKER